MLRMTWLASHVRPWFLGSDGIIYGIPENADKILRIIPPARRCTCSAHILHDFIPLSLKTSTSLRFRLNHAAGGTCAWSVSYVS